MVPMYYHTEPYILQAEPSKSKMKFKKMEICPEPSKSNTEIHSGPLRESEILLEFVEEQEYEKRGFKKFLQ